MYSYEVPAVDVHIKASLYISARNLFKNKVLIRFLLKASCVFKARTPTEFKLKIHKHISRHVYIHYFKRTRKY